MRDRRVNNNRDTASVFNKHFWHLIDLVAKLNAPPPFAVIKP